MGRYISFQLTDNSIVICKIIVGADAHIRPRVDVGIDPYGKGERYMKATGIADGWTIWAEW